MSLEDAGVISDRRSYKYPLVFRNLGTNIALVGYSDTSESVSVTICQPLAVAVSAGCYFKQGQLRRSDVAVAFLSADSGQPNKCPLLTLNSRRALGCDNSSFFST
jgi:hypothetical protein